MEKLTKDEFHRLRLGLEEDLRILKKRYTKDCAKYPVGTKLKLTDTHRDGSQHVTMAIVTEHQVYGSEIREVLFKMNKDGSKHAKARANIWTDTKVEII